MYFSTAVFEGRLVVAGEISSLRVKGKYLQSGRYQSCRPIDVFGIDIRIHSSGILRVLVYHRVGDLLLRSGGVQGFQNSTLQEELALLAATNSNILYLH